LARTLLASKNLKTFMKFRTSLPGGARTFDQEKAKLIQGCRRADQGMLTGDPGGKPTETAEATDKIDAWARRNCRMKVQLIRHAR